MLNLYIVRWADGTAASAAIRPSIYQAVALTDHVWGRSIGTNELVRLDGTVEDRSGRPWRLRVHSLLAEALEESQRIGEQIDRDDVRLADARLEYSLAASGFPRR